MKLAPVALVIASLACAHASPLPTRGLILDDAQISSCQKAPILSEVPPVESYWQAGTFADSPDEIVRNWYSAQLCSMGEAPLLKPMSNDSLRIRLLWLRSFDPTISVRVDFDGGAARIVAVEMTGPDESESPGSIARRESRRLSAEEWRRVESTLDASNFWSTTSEKILCCDGARWIFEVAIPGRYHVVDRWGGDHLESLGRELLSLSGLDPQKFY